jgi:hypothetical protein
MRHYLFGVLWFSLLMALTMFDLSRIVIPCRGRSVAGAPWQYLFPSFLGPPFLVIRAAMFAAAFSIWPRLEILPLVPRQWIAPIDSGYRWHGPGVPWRHSIVIFLMACYFGWVGFQAAPSGCSDDAFLLTHTMPTYTSWRFLVSSTLWAALWACVFSTSCRLGGEQSRQVNSTARESD